MSIVGKIVSGVVNNGLLVPQVNSDLPEGTHVNIVLQPADMPPELKEELEAWQRGGQSDMAIDRQMGGGGTVKIGDIHWVDLPGAGGRALVFQVLALDRSQIGR